MGLRRAAPVDDIAIAERRLALALSRAGRPDVEDVLPDPRGDLARPHVAAGGWTPGRAAPEGASPSAVRVLSGPVPRRPRRSDGSADDGAPDGAAPAAGAPVLGEADLPPAPDRAEADWPPAHDPLPAPHRAAPDLRPAPDRAAADWPPGPDPAVGHELGPRLERRGRRQRRRRTATAASWAAVQDRLPVSWRAAVERPDAAAEPRPRWGLDRPQVLVLAALCLGGLVLTATVVLGGRSDELVVPMARAAASPSSAATAPTPSSEPEESPAGAAGPVGPAPVAGLPGSAAAPSTGVVVHVTGLVVTPGLVQLAAGARVDDAIRAAGGAQPGVDLGGLNLARPVLDGEQIAVGIPAAPDAGGSPFDRAAAGSTAVGPAAADAGVVDLNRATLADLDGLPGVGPVLAQRILDWRGEHGRFSSVDELQEVSGIGPQTFADLAPRVRV